MDADGKSIGQVSIKKEDDGLLVKTTVTGLKPGNYAFHLHTVGKCEAPGFTSAEGHWNPTGKEHGKDNPQGKHMGDLPNIEVTASGSGSLEQKIRSEEHTSELQSLMRISYAVFCLKKKNKHQQKCEIQDNRST